MIEITVISTTHIPELAPLQAFVYALFSFPHQSAPSHLTSPAQNFGQALELRPTNAFILSLLLAIIGASLRLAAYKGLGHMFTFEMSIRRDHKLITHGVYGWVRHPAYTGVLLFAAGVWGCFASRVEYRILPGPSLRISLCIPGLFLLKADHSHCRVRGLENRASSITPSDKRS